MGNRREDGIPAGYVGQDTALASLSVKLCCCDYRLSQAQTAISGRHFFLREHLKSSFGQPRFEPFGQVNVVKRPATQAYTVEVRFLPQERCKFDEPLN